MDDLTRLRNEYGDRKQRFQGKDVYSWLNTATLFAIQQRQKTILDVLKRQGLTNISDLSILEMGCGEGEVLREFLAFGVSPGNLCGIDLLGDRISEAHRSLPGSNFAHADGQSLPFPSQTFDIVLQFTAISSILDTTIRENVCMDMLRVLKKKGLVLSYDFWLNPTNPQTHGIRPKEIHRLFPGCQIQFHRITLAPPIARRLVPVSWLLSAFLEKLKVFNSHYLSVIRRF